MTTEAVYTPQIHSMHVPSHSGHMSEHLGLVLHVAEANGSVHGYFANPAHQASSTWWVAKSGRIEEYVPSTLEAWAQAAGNATYNSVETEGYTTEALTLFQLAGLAWLYRQGMSKFHWPDHLADKPGQRGLGWHGMGGQAWGGHTGCPGDLRKNERVTILHLATAQNCQPVARALQQEVEHFKRTHGLPHNDVIGPRVRHLLGL